MTPLFRKFLGINWLLVAVVALLLVFGVYSLRAVTGFLPGVVIIGKVYLFECLLNRH